MFLTKRQEAPGQEEEQGEKVSGEQRWGGEEEGLGRQEGREEHSVPACREEGRRSWLVRGAGSYVGW